MKFRDWYPGNLFHGHYFLKCIFMSEQKGEEKNNSAMRIKKKRKEFSSQWIAWMEMRMKRILEKKKKKKQQGTGSTLPMFSGVYNSWD